MDELEVRGGKITLHVTYTTTFDAICPVAPNVVDHYEVVIEADEMIKVEELLAVLAQSSRQPMFQEDITQEIAMRFAQIGKVTTTGTHSGVVTVCTVSA